MIGLSLLAGAALMVSCGGGGGTSPAGSPPAITGTFTPAQANPGAKSMALSQLSVSGDIVAVAINVKDTNGLYGAAFDLDYDPVKVDYLDYQVGNALEPGLPAGSTVLYNIAESAPGRLVASITRQGNVAGKDISGSQRLVTVRFRVLEAGNFPVVFPTGAELYDAQSPPQTIAGVTWDGGTLTGQ